MPIKFWVQSRFGKISLLLFVAMTSCSTGTDVKRVDTTSEVSSQNISAMNSSRVEMSKLDKLFEKNKKVETPQLANTYFLGRMPLKSSNKESFFVEGDSTNNKADQVKFYDKSGLMRSRFVSFNRDCRDEKTRHLHALYEFDPKIRPSYLDRVFGISQNHSVKLLFGLFRSFKPSNEPFSNWMALGRHEAVYGLYYRDGPEKYEVVKSDAGVVLVFRYISALRPNLVRLSNKKATTKRYGRLRIVNQNIGLLDNDFLFEDDKLIVSRPRLISFPIE